MSAPPKEEQYEAYVGRIARGAGISSFGQGIGRAIAYVTQVVLARMYGPAQLGFYVLGVTVVGLASTLARVGMEVSIVRFVAEYRVEGNPSKVRGTILLSLLVSFALSLALSALAFLGAGFLANEVFDKPPLESIFRVISLCIPFLTVMYMALWATQGFQTVKYATYVREISQPLMSLGLIVIFYLLGAQVLGAVVAYVLSMAAGSALGLYYLMRIFSGLLDRNLRPEFEGRAFFRVSIPILVTSVMEYVNAWIAITLVGVLLSGEKVGIYSAAVRTAALAAAVYIAFDGIFAPIISDLHRRGLLEELDYLYKEVSRWIFTSGLIVFLVTSLLSRDIMAVFGEDFVTGWVVLVIIAASQLLSSSIGATNRVLSMTGHQNVLMLATVGAAATALVGSAALIPVYGILGAAWATAASIVLGNAITLAAIYRRMNLWPYSGQYLKPIAAGFLAAGVVGLTRWLIPISSNILSILVFALLFMAVFAAMLLVLGLNTSDRQFLGALWTAVRQKIRPGG
jgi:O-antigen/teichoic acid export membrane protein